MQFIDLKAQYNALQSEIDNQMKNVLLHGQYISGSEVNILEKKLAVYVGRRHCITCGNGTDALQIIYMTYGIGKGDAVFCPDVTFIASVEPAMMLGATPVFCDITDDTYNICPQSLEQQINAVVKEGKLKPRAVVAVDFLGNPADYDAISQICKKYNLLLIQDAAQSFGAEYGGKKCCSFGEIAATSFFPAKPLGCYGDGGAIFTDNDGVADICRSIAVHGKGPGGKYDNVRVGMNSRLDTLQAAILLPKLKALEEYEIQNRQKIAQAYNDAFANDFVTPFVNTDTLSVYAQYALLASSREQRDTILRHLTEHGIPNMIYYPTPQHELPVFVSCNNYGEQFLNATKYCSTTFSIPMHPYLTQEDLEQIVAAVRGAL